MKVGEIEKDVKLERSTTFAFLDTLEVGDSILVEDMDEKARKRLGTACRGRKKSHDKAFSVKKVVDTDDSYRVWRTK